MDHFQYPGYPPYYMQSPPYPYLMNPPPMPTVSSVQSSDGFGYVAKVRFGSGPAIKKSWVFFLGFWILVIKIHVGFGFKCHFSGSGQVWVAKRSGFPGFGVFVYPSLVTIFSP